LGNDISNVCRRVRDCGAIHVNDRGRRSTGIVIENNAIRGFGSPSVLGRGIYLDDWASQVIVRGNYITGPGLFPFQIHGGHGNRIENNVIDMVLEREALLYQPEAGENWNGMHGNSFVGNRFLRQVGAAAPLLGVGKVPPTAQPTEAGNLACAQLPCVEIK
jgi:hypothetical protein